MAAGPASRSRGSSAARLRRAEPDGTEPVLGRANSSGVLKLLPSLKLAVGRETRRSHKTEACDLARESGSASKGSKEAPPPVRSRFSSRPTPRPSCLLPPPASPLPPPGATSVHV